MEVNITRTVGQMMAEATAAVPAVKAQDVQRRMQEDSNTLIIDVCDGAQVREASILVNCTRVDLRCLRWLY
jgi:hypothetical protein